MSELSKKKLGKIIGLRKSDFNEFIKLKQIKLSKPRLIPVFKLGDELALTSVLLSSFRLIKEFKDVVFSEAKLQKGGTLYVYTEVEFSSFPDSRLDGLALIVKSGIIRDAAIFEMKNGKNFLDKLQLEKYQKVAQQLSIPKFITISNEFVTDAKQSPANIKPIKGVGLYHFSWTYLLTIAHVLLFKNDTNIADEDQIEIMREVVNYFEHDKSGVFGVNQMSSSWVSIIDKITTGSKIKTNDTDLYEAVKSWQQKERDMALFLSRELGVLVSSGEAKYKGKLEDRLRDNCKQLVDKKFLNSIYRVKGAASEIIVTANIEKRTVEMSVSLKAPEDKTYKGRIGWLKRQLDFCVRKDESAFNQLSKNLYFDVLVKKSSQVHRYSIFSFDSAIDDMKGKDLREFRLIYIKDLGKFYTSPRKFVDITDSMLIDFYRTIIQYLSKWEPAAPKIKNGKQLDDEQFITDIDNQTMDYEESKVESEPQSPDSVRLESKGSGNLNL